MPPKSKKPEPINRTAIITTTITVIGTIIAALVAAPWIKDAFQRALTPTVVPTVTATPTPSLPASTNTPNCSPDLADRLFKYALNENKELDSSLGSQRMSLPLCIESTYQPFEHGEMIWRADVSDIYVLFETQEWMAYSNKHRKGDPELSCIVETPRESRFQPTLGFGKVWCDNPSVKEKLGYAFVGENYGYRALQTFENGWLILINHTVRAMVGEGENWEAIDAFKFTQVSLATRSDLDTKKSNLGLEQEGFIYLPKSPLTMRDPLTESPLTMPFEVEWKVSTQCADTPEYPEHIQITTSVPRPIGVYLLIQAGWGVDRYRHKTIGKVSLKFDQGETLDTDLQLGINIRDWAERPRAITTLDSRYTQTAWEGFDQVPGRIDILILDIPEMYFSSILKEILIEDHSILTAKSMDPCIHLSGVTVSYLP